MTSEDPLIHRDRYLVTSWDADARGQLATAALGRYLQETALHHADRLGLGIAALQGEGLTWVVGALLVRVHRYPVYEQEVILETWPRTAQGKRAPRDFRLYDEGGTELAAISGVYFLMDLASRHAASLERFAHRTWRDVRALDRDAGRVPNLTEADAEIVRSLPVRWSDLDLLGHVTNSRYLDLALETYSPEFLATHEIAEMEANFLAEGRYPGAIRSRRSAAQGDATTFRHSLAREEDGRELYRARLVWRDA